MEHHRRFAIYWAPEPGPLADFTAAWLGWDAARGAERPHPDVANLPRPVAELTETPRKYGFHGTLKAPFRLADGTTAQGLDRAVADLAGRTAPVTLDGLKLAALGRFLALVPDGPAEGLNRLAATLVTELDTFRAPLTAEDLIRRRATDLPARQREMLERYGYPYVMEEFRFHLTLTGPLDPEAAEATRRALAPVMTPLLPRPFHIGSVCLFGEGEDGRFRNLHRYTLSG